MLRNLQGSYFFIPTSLCHLDLSFSFKSKPAIHNSAWSPWLTFCDTALLSRKARIVTVVHSTTKRTWDFFRMCRLVLYIRTLCIRFIQYTCTFSLSRARRKMSTKFGAVLPPGLCDTITLRPLFCLFFSSSFLLMNFSLYVAEFSLKHTLTSGLQFEFKKRERNWFRRSGPNTVTWGTP